MTEQDCRHCKDYRDCIGKDWYNYAEIRWCIYQIIWILKNYTSFMAGRWPKDPYGSGSNGQRIVQTEATFVKPILILAEVRSRLKRTGSQGELLITQIEDGRTLSTLSDGAREVLMYIKGNRRKRIGFRRWLRKVYYRPKSTPKGQLVGVI